MQTGVMLTGLAGPYVNTVRPPHGLHGLTLVLHLRAHDNDWVVILIRASTILRTSCKYLLLGTICPMPKHVLNTGLIAMRHGLSTQVVSLMT